MSVMIYNPEKSSVIYGKQALYNFYCGPELTPKATSILSLYFGTRTPQESLIDFGLTDEADNTSNLQDFLDKGKFLRLDKDYWTMVDNCPTKVRITSVKITTDDRGTTYQSHYEADFVVQRKYLLNKKGTVSRDFSDIYMSLADLLQSLRNLAGILEE